VKKLRDKYGIAVYPIETVTLQQPTATSNQQNSFESTKPIENICMIA